MIEPEDYGCWDADGWEECVGWIAPSFVDALGLHFLLPFELEGWQHPVPDVLSRQCGKDLVKYTHAASANEPIADRLMRTVGRRYITPSKTIADYEDNAADDPTIIDPWHAMQ